MQKLVLIKVI